MNDYSNTWNTDAADFLHQTLIDVNTCQHLLALQGSAYICDAQKMEIGKINIPAIRQ